MSPLDPWLLQSSVWRCVEHLAAGEPVPHPIAVELHLGTTCNLACPECVSRPTLDTATFEPDRALGVARELASTGVRCVVLSGGGEPLLHPSAAGVMESLHDAGVSLGLVTNGTLLHLHLQTVASCAARIRVSVDAATAATYDRFRPQRGGGSSFQRVLRNLERIAPLAHDRLTYSFVLLTRQAGVGAPVDSNAADLAEAARLAKSQGCAAYEVGIGLDARLQPAPSHALVSSLQSDELHAALQSADNDFRVLVDPMGADLAAGRGLREFPARGYARCPAAQIRALVGPRGVSLCPRHQCLPRAIYGDPCVTPLREIWGGTAFQAAIARVDPRSDCTGACMSMQLNDQLLCAVDWLRTHGAAPPLTDDHDLFM